MYPKKQEKVYRGVQSYITYTVCCKNERVNLKNVPRYLKKFIFWGTSPQHLRKNNIVVVITE